jgi:hypothetical protein
MHPVLCFLLIAAAVIILTAPLSALVDAVRQSKRLAMERRLQRFEAEQRVRQQAAVMKRTRQINAFTNETCKAMLQAALEAQQEELKRTHK